MILETSGRAGETGSARVAQRYLSPGAGPVIAVVATGGGGSGGKGAEPGDGGVGGGRDLLEEVETGHGVSLFVAVTHEKVVSADDRGARDASGAA